MLVEALGAGHQFNLKMSDLHARFADLITQQLVEAVAQGLVPPLAPVIFGTLMDGRRFGEVLVGIAVLQTLAIFTALRVGKTA